MGKFVFTDRYLIEERYIKKIFTRNEGNCPFEVKMKNNMMGKICGYYRATLERIFL